MHRLQKKRARFKDVIIIIRFCYLRHRQRKSYTFLKIIWQVVMKACTSIVNPPDVGKRSQMQTRKPEESRTWQTCDGTGRQAMDRVQCGYFAKQPFVPHEVLGCGPILNKMVPPFFTALYGSMGLSHVFPFSFTD